jgi:hypothetical protein
LTASITRYTNSVDRFPPPLKFMAARVIGRLVASVAVALRTMAC